MLKRTAQNQLTIFSAKFSRKFTSKNLDSIRPFEYKNNLKNEKRRIIQKLSSKKNT